MSGFNQGNLANIEILFSYMRVKEPLPNSNVHLQCHYFLSFLFIWIILYLDNNKYSYLESKLSKYILLKWLKFIFYMHNKCSFVIDFIIHINCEHFKLQPYIINFSDYKVQSQNKVAIFPWWEPSIILILVNTSYGIDKKPICSNISSMSKVREYLNFPNNFNKVAFVALK